MEEMLLARPSMEYAGQIAAYRREFLDAGDSLDGTGALRRVDDPAEWVRQSLDYEDAAKVPPNWVPATQFIYVRKSDNRLVGMIQVRHRFNGFLEKYAGHIGYSVRPGERRKGYASRMLAQCLPFCKTIGLERVLISCNTDNEASRRTILKNGGVYESTVFEPGETVNLERYWIML